jgi:hypothetical protein
MKIGIVAAVVSAALACLSGFGAAATGAVRAIPVLDVELAFDTTSSMTPSLDRARQDALEVVAGVRNIVPDARFGVVSFRERGNPGGEYETLQPLTADTAAVQRALGKLRAIPDPSPSNLPEESYNLAFHRSYTDDALGWRPDARKIVVVIGDAEPFHAGSAGIPGCQSTHDDPDGLNVKGELSGMRKAARTLIMIREVSVWTSTSLACYQSLASLAYTGGAARDGGSSDLVTPLVALMRGAVAPITVTPASRFILPGTQTRLTATVANPNGFAVQLNSLTLSVRGLTNATAAPPPATQAGTTLTWNTPQTLQPHSTVVVTLNAKASSTPGVAKVTATGNAQFEAGNAFTTVGQATIYVTRRLVIRAHASTGRGSIGGSVSVALPKSRQSASAAALSSRAGQFTIRSGKRSVTFRPSAYRLSISGDRATATIRIRVAGSSTLSGCAVGTRGTLTVTERSLGGNTSNGSARVTLPARCSPGETQWLAHAASLRAGI